jgi:hypothetical protein
MRWRGTCVASGLRCTDWSISVSRITAMPCIAAYHLCQLRNLAAAWSLNVGVQVFLVISGWLCGLRAFVTDAGCWHWWQLVRIGVPYWAILLLLFAADVLFAVHASTMRRAVLSVPCVRSGPVPNGAHLWYVSVILLIASMLGLLWMRWRLWPSPLSPLSLFTVGNRLVVEGSCFCYVMAFGMGRLAREGVPETRALPAVVIVCSAGHMVSAAMSKPIATLPYYPFRLYGGFLGSFLGILAVGGSSVPLRGSAERLLKWSDAYSYRVYLTKQLLNLDDFSLAAVLHENPVAVIALVFSWLIAAPFVLHQITGLVYRATGVERR